jgi:NAD(P)-dependent dehydrogenase (short-subunit alcohol dehydrogenase family)
MQGLVGKTAFVTGGASGIGLALGRAFAEADMKVMLADIEADLLSAAVKSLDKFGEVRGITCDVADLTASTVLPRCPSRLLEMCMWFATMRVSGLAAASTTFHLDNWRWVFDVNVMGVLHGIRAFLPHMRSHGEGGHFVNTASMAGIAAGQFFNP